MNKYRLAKVLVPVAFLGAAIPFFVPNDWLKYAFGAGLLGVMVAVALAMANAERKDVGLLGIVSFLTIGTFNPTAEVKDPRALLVLVASLVFLAGFTVGAFGLVS